MPANFDALLRYHTIDHCLQNRARNWTWQDLANACFSMLDEARYRSGKNTISKRTIENDIRIMRSSLLGYNAPIVCKNGFYSYADKNYSIRNTTLSPADIQHITMAAKVLGQYRGFDFFIDLNGIFEKFESSLQLKLSHEIVGLVEFEKIPDAHGSHLLQELLDIIRQKKAVWLSYKRFDNNSEKQHLLHPYLLKEYKNRWYLLGLNAKHKQITTYALDRIRDYKIADTEPYISNTIFNSESYFKDTIGITYTGKPAQRIVIRVNNNFAPYFLTQPIHSSQQLLKSDTENTTFQLNVVVNPELLTLLLGYAEHTTVVSPVSLKKQLSDMIHKATENYN